MFSAVGDVGYCEGRSVIWRMFSILEDVHYCGGFSVLFGLLASMEDVKYSKGCSVPWRMYSTRIFLINNCFISKSVLEKTKT